VNQTATVVVVFCDLVESTALMSSVGDDDADRIRREMFTKWRAVIEDAAGTIVKTAGDGFMAVFPSSAGNAVRAADSLLAAMPTIDSPRPLQVRIGIAAGEAAHEDGDWFGTPVVEAARLCAAADPNEVLLSETARKLVGSRGGYQFTAVGSLTLKGLARPLPSYALGSRARRRRNRRAPTRWIAAAVGVALVVGGAVFALERSGSDENNTASPVVPKPRGYTPTLTDRACTPEESAGDSTVSCQTLEVPENRDVPDGRTVKLAVVRAPATDARANTVPTVSIGPTFSQPAGDALRSASTLIRLGLRGRGDSTPLLACSEFGVSRAERLAAPSSDAGVRYDADRVTCLERLRSSGIDLNQYDVSDIADDMRDLAFALHIPRIAFHASADSARAALVVIRRYPGLLEAVVMDNADVPPFSTLTGLPSRYDQALALLAQRCDENTACKTSIPDGLVSAVDAMRERLAANPPRVTVPVGNGRTEVLLDDDRFMQTVALALNSDPSTLALIPSVVARGDPTPVAAYFASAFTNYEENSAWKIIEWCAEDAGSTTKTLLEAQATAQPRWRSIVNPGALDVCERFDLGRVPDLTTPPASPIPVFIVQGALTPGGSRSVLSTFSAGLTHVSLLVLRNEGFIADTAPPCVDALRVAFLRDPGASLDTDACADADPPLRFAA
jgi:class 3 adenylate cyclase/pimeloyl-ACP methyl ester carboxylesterase